MHVCMQEVAEPMFDLKVGIEELRRSRTLKYILATMLSVGNFLNGSEVVYVYNAVLSWLKLFLLCGFQSLQN